MIGQGGKFRWKVVYVISKDLLMNQSRRVLKNRKVRSSVCSHRNVVASKPDVQYLDDAVVCQSCCCTIDQCDLEHFQIEGLGG